MITIRFACLLVTATSLATLGNARSEQTPPEKAQVHTRTAVRKANEASRSADEKLCTALYGKTDCVGKMIKNDLSNAKDVSTDKAEELKDKLD